MKMSVPLPLGVTHLYREAVRPGAPPNPPPDALPFAVELVRRARDVGPGASHDLALDGRRGPLRERAPVAAAAALALGRRPRGGDAAVVVPALDLHDHRLV